MGQYTRDEIETAYAHYRETAKRCGNGGQQWDEWADLFTEDAVYYEHLYGRFEGREAIRTWIQTTMNEFPNNEMTDFPADWWVIDEEKGWVLAAVWNRMQDLGDGEVYQAINWSRLDYAGNNQWSYEEDIYNVEEFAVMVQGVPRGAQGTPAARLGNVRTDPHDQGEPNARCHLHRDDRPVGRGRHARSTRARPTSSSGSARAASATPTSRPPTARCPRRRRASSATRAPGPSSGSGPR